MVTQTPNGVDGSEYINDKKTPLADYELNRFLGLILNKSYCVLSRKARAIVTYSNRRQATAYYFIVIIIFTQPKRGTGANNLSTVQSYRWHL